MKKIDKIDIRLWPFKVPVEGRSCDCCCTMAAGDSAGRLGVAIVGVVMSIQHSALTGKIAIMACFESAGGIVRPVSKEPSDSDLKTFPKRGQVVSK
jgi:hypothetical protein